MTIDSNFFDTDVARLLEQGEFTVREVASWLGVPLIKARRSLTRLHKQKKVRAVRMPASAHLRRGPRPLKYSLRSP